MFRKKLEKDDLFPILVNIFEQDLKKLPGWEENDERFIWVFIQIGNGTLKNGFGKGSCCCKGGGITQKKSFETEFINFLRARIGSVENTLIEIEIKEMGLIIRRYFKIDSDGVVPVCRFCNIRESIRSYVERRVFKGKEIKENKMRLTHDVIKQGGEKLRPPKK